MQRSLFIHGMTLLVAGGIAIASPPYASAQEVTIRTPCKNGVPYTSVGANYTPGVDVNGNAVVSADIDGGVQAFTYPLSIPVELDVLRVLDLDVSSALAQAGEFETKLGDVILYEDGRVEYNGQDISSSVETLCAGAQDGNVISVSPAQTAPEDITVEPLSPPQPGTQPSTKTPAVAPPEPNAQTVAPAGRDVEALRAPLNPPIPRVKPRLVKPTQEAESLDLAPPADQGEDTGQAVALSAVEPAAGRDEQSQQIEKSVLPVEANPPASNAGDQVWRINTIEDLVNNLRRQSRDEREKQVALDRQAVINDVGSGDVSAVDLKRPAPVFKTDFKSLINKQLDDE